MTVEDLLTECGGFGKYQVLLIFGVFIHKVLAGWSMLQMSYAGYTPDWNCQLAGHNVTNAASSLKKCSLNDTSTGTMESCRSYRFDGSMRTVITEWDLVCDEKWVKATITSIQMAGVLLGAVLSGQLADAYGRKKTLFGFALLHAMFNFAAAFSPSWGVFAAFRFFIGLGTGAILVVTVPYGMEFMPIKWRPLLSILPHWPAGVSLFAVAAFFLEDWAQLHIAVGILGLPTLVGIFYVPESVRWLTLKGRYEEAEKVFKKMATVNGKEPPKQTRAVLERLYMEEQELKSTTREYTYWHLFKGWKNAKISLISCYAWFMLSMVFYGISFGVSALSGNLYLNIFLVGILEVPFNLSTFYFNNRFGRKVTFITLLVVGGIFACACLVVKVLVDSEDQAMWITGFSIASKVGFGAAWTVSQTWVSELYPTVVRSLGYGLVNTAARLGGIVAPFSVDLDKRPLTAYAIITAMVVVAIVMTLFVPDTRDMVLSDSLINYTATKSTPPSSSSSSSSPRLNKQQQQNSHETKDYETLTSTEETNNGMICLNENGKENGGPVSSASSSDETLVHRF